MRMQLTKRDMVKVILTALYNRDHTLTDDEIENNDLWRRRVNRLLRKSKSFIESQYKPSLDILTRR